MGFRKDFIWGAATAAYQIEGAAYEDGKGLSVWDTFCKQPGKILENHTGDVACDHYHRYKEDIALMKELGLKAYRFSLSWPRIMPNGTGKVNDKGIRFYSNLIDELLKNGITPYATLFHWDYPNDLFCRGGWMNPDSPKWFADYTEVCAKAFGDKLKHFFTLNEPQCFIGLSYQETLHAPGIRFPVKDALQMSHNVLLSHGHSVQALRAYSKDCVIGIAPTGKSYYPATDNVLDVEAARNATFSVPKDWSLFSINWWSDPIFLGTYPEAEAFRGIEPVVKSGDMELIKQPIDFYGQNVYNALPVVHDDKLGYRVVPFPVGHAKTAMGWPVTPEVLYWLPKFLYERYKTPIIISENGLSCHDAVSPDGHVHDPNRIDFLRAYIGNLEKSASDGVDIRGYFQWSLMDNFEWSFGYSDRFGMIYIDYQTQQRIIKDSAYWYKSLIETNSVELARG